MSEGIEARYYPHDAHASEDNSGVQSARPPVRLTMIICPSVGMAADCPVQEVVPSCSLPPLLAIIAIAAAFAPPRASCWRRRRRAPAADVGSLRLTPPGTHSATPVRTCAGGAERRQKKHRQRERLCKIPAGPQAALPTNTTTTTTNSCTTNHHAQHHCAPPCTSSAARGGVGRARKHSC